MVTPHSNHSQTPFHILAVAGEPTIVEFLRVGLEPEGYAVSAATNADGTLDHIGQKTVGLVILDLSQSSRDGLEICRRVRETSDIPIVVLAERDQISTRVAALDLGADACLVKPFGMAELSARLHAILRRSGTPEHR
jgi:DNA-binding response OmpR family regulator